MDNISPEAREIIQPKQKTNRLNMNVIQKQQTEKIEEHKKSSSIENTRLQQRKSQNAHYVVS